MSMENLDYTSIYKTDNEILDSIKENLIRMLFERNLINKENIENKVSKIKNNKNDIFNIKFDNTKNYNSNFEDDEILIKVFNYNITSIAKGSEIQEFIIKNINKYKILIVNDITEKSINSLKQLSNIKKEENGSNLEIFTFFELSFIVIDNILQPKFIPLNKDEEQQFLEEYPTIKKKDLKIILNNDPVSKFYNFKTNNIIKVIRTTPVGMSFEYKLVY